MSESTPPAACTRGEEPTVTVWMALTSEQQCKSSISVMRLRTCNAQGCIVKQRLFTAVLPPPHYLELSGELKEGDKEYIFSIS